MTFMLCTSLLFSALKLATYPIRHPLQTQKGISCVVYCKTAAKKAPAKK